jgi:hypothetical protein
MSALLPIATAKADSREKSCPLYPPKADVCDANCHVCFGPKADMTASFNHLVGSPEQCGRQFNPERLGGLEIRASSVH